MLKMTFMASVISIKFDLVHERFKRAKATDLHKNMILNQQKCLKIYNEVYDMS